MKIENKSSKTNEEFNYIINVVPTKLRTTKFTKDTYQYAVTQHAKETEEHRTGIFFKYDFAGLGVEVIETRESLRYKF